MRILITGSRYHQNKNLIKDALLAEVVNVSDDEEITLVSGNCPTGADFIAEEVAESLGWVVERHPADWEAHGKKAGPIRNSQMVRKGADVCLAFPLGDSRGTRGCLKMAQKAGIPTRVFED